VPSPEPLEVVEWPAIRTLLAARYLVVAVGGGGIPVFRCEDGSLHGIEAVVDKDLASALLAAELEADVFVMATDTDAVYLDWGTPAARPVGRVNPDELSRYSFAEGSMGPKVEAACEFVRRTGRRAAIGALDDVEAMVDGTAGTQVVA